MSVDNSSSVVWEFFEVAKDDPTIAKCLQCGNKYSRGKTPKTYSTKSLLDHLNQKHTFLFQSAVAKRDALKSQNAKEVFFLYFYQQLTNMVPIYAVLYFRNRKNWKQESLIKQHRRQSFSLSILKDLFRQITLTKFA